MILNQSTAYIITCERWDVSQYLRSMEGCRLACTIRRRTTQNHPPPPPFGMLNHYWLASPTPSSLVPVFPNNSLVPTCTLEGERGTVRVKRLAQEPCRMSPARAQTQTAQSGIKLTNREAATVPTQQL